LKTPAGIDYDVAIAMKRLATHTALALILGLIPTTMAAQGLIAMRVDTEAIRSVGELTAVALVIQIAPEDRVRVGTDAWVKAELRDGDTVVDRLERAAAVDQHGVVRLESVWSPGEYSLRVDVGGTRGTGFWRGRISVPLIETEAEKALAASLEPTAAEEPQPAAEPADRPDPAAEPLAAPEETEEVVVAAPKAVEIPDAAGEIPADTKEMMSETEPAAEPAPVEPPAPAPVAVETPEPEPVQGEAPLEAEPIPTRPAEPAPEVEPPAPASEAPPTSAAVAPALDPGQGKDPVVAYEQEIDTGLAELNVIVTEKSRPVVSLLRSQVRLKVDGKETLIESLTGADEVPLSLGFAVDTSSSMGEYLDALRGLLGRLSIKAAGDRGRFFVLTQGEEPRLAVDWSSKPSELNQTLARAETASEASLAEMVTAAIEPFSGRRGRKVLLIVTDGGDTATRADWRAVLDDAGAAGVTVFVIGFQGDSLTIRTRSSLERLATSTGGEFYFIPDREMLKMVVDYYSGLIDGSYNIGFRAPRGKLGKPYRIRVEIAGRTYDVRYPQSMRWQ
jgi:VWFA-related protein